MHCRVSRVCPRCYYWKVQRYVDVLYDESNDCEVLGSFLHHTIEIPKNSRKRTSNIVAATDLDKQKTKKTVKDVRGILHNEKQKELDGTQTIAKICDRVRLTFYVITIQRKKLLFVVFEGMSVPYFSFLNFDILRK